MRSRRPGTANEALQEYTSIDHFADAAPLPDGRLSIDYLGRPVDYFFRDHPSKTMVVTFHGAARATVNLPWFTGKGVMEGVEAKWLAMSDPSLALDSELGLSWFAGSRHQPQLQTLNAQIIDLICQTSGVEHLIFLGGSGGGFAALEMSRRFPGSLAIPMNPQTAIGNYYEGLVAIYLGKAWAGKSLTDSALKSITHDLVSSYTPDHTNTIAYVQNTRDRFHIRKHQRPFLGKLKASQHLWRLEGAWGDPAKTGHVIPPKEKVHQILRYMALANGEWDQALPEAGFSQTKS